MIVLYTWKTPFLPESTWGKTFLLSVLIVLEGPATPLDGSGCHRVWGMSWPSRFSVRPSRHALPTAASALFRSPRATPREVQKDAVVLRLWVQRLQDVVRHDLRAGRGAGTGAGVWSQSSGGCGGVGHQRAVRVLTWRGLWEDAGGVMLRLEDVGMCRTVGASGPRVRIGRHSVCRKIC